jgi:2-dehydropantoate 2-reductase
LKIAIFGAGAIGGLLAVRLASSGADVTLIARGAHLAAMRAKGVTLISGGESVTLRLRCLEDPAEAGIQDYVIVTLKAHALPEAGISIASMIGPHSTIVTAVNGIPYWYFYGLEGTWHDRHIESVDPGGLLWRSLPPQQIVGCVVYPAAEVVEPGIILHSYGDRFSLGEPNGQRTSRAEMLSRQLISAGLKAPIRPRIRDEIWVKLWGNLCFNPISALTGATLDRIAGDDGLYQLCVAMMEESQKVAEALGVRFSITITQRIQGAAEVGHHKTSMLQDLERGRAMEIDAVLGAVVELGSVTCHKLPVCRAVLALLRERGRLAGCYGPL